MSETKRPKPTDEGAVTKRWSPREDLSETALMPAVPAPASRRATVTMGAVRPAVGPAPIEAIPPPPSSSPLPNTPATLPPPTVHMAADPIAHDAGGGVELLIVEEQMSSSAREKKAWRAAEVWTKRRVYGLDSTFKCVEIIDRETGLPERGHEMLGARLGGGRQRENEKVRFSYPLPLPGMEAMFMKQKKHGYTSAVERMVVRVRVLVTSADEALPSWDEIASRWSDPPPAK